MKNQRGMTLLELCFFLIIASGMTLLGFQNSSNDRDQNQARTTGQQLFAYNNAVRAWVSDNIGAAASVKTGSAWLKSTSCTGGLSSVGYLPCSFPDATTAKPLPGGKLALTSTVNTTGTAPNQQTVVTTTTSAYIVFGKTRSDLSGLAAIIAAAGSKKSIYPAGSDTSFNSNQSTAMITMTAGNSGSTDSWLRTDGSNLQNGAIRFNTALAAGQRELQNVSRVQNIAANALTLGNAGGGAAGYSIIVDANETVTGNQVVQNVQGKANGVTLTRGNIVVAAGGMETPSQLVAGGAIYTPIMRDKDNTGYYIDPNNTSVMNVGNNSLNTVAPIFYDRDNTSYYVDPAGTTAMYSAVIANMNVDGNWTTNLHADTYNQLNFTTAVGTSTWCSPRGAFARDTAGHLVACTASVFGDLWQRPILGHNVGVYSVSIPAGTPSAGIGTQKSVPLGAQQICVLTGSYQSHFNESHCQVHPDLSGWYLDIQVNGTAGANFWCEAMCLAN